MPRRFASLAAVSFTVACMTLGACSSGGSAVTGEVTKLDRMALPPEAVVTVELRDVSRADAPATTVSSQVISLDGRQLPVPYELRYDEANIDERFTYVVYARIDSADSLIYITDTANAVITNGAPTSDVEVLVVPAN